MTWLKNCKTLYWNIIENWFTFHTFNDYQIKKIKLLPQNSVDFSGVSHTRVNKNCIQSFLYSGKSHILFWIHSSFYFLILLSINSPKQNYAASLKIILCRKSTNTIHISISHTLSGLHQILNRQNVILPYKIMLWMFSLYLKE